MATNVTLNGVVYSIPAEGDSSWGNNVSSYLIAIAASVFQKTGGNFTLTSEVDFGATYGLKSTYFKSRATNPSSTGIIRLGNDEGISWRNQGNSSDLSLKVNSSNQLEFNGGNLSGSVPSITGSRGTPQDISASGIAFAGSSLFNTWFVQGNGGAINISANPQIAAGTTVGQRLTLIGRSDINTITLEDGDGLSLKGNCILEADTIIGLYWDGTNWTEETRNV